MPASAESRRRYESLSRAALADHQLARLNELLAAILPTNAFYAEKFASLKLPLASLDQLSELPMTSKEEFIADATARDHSNRDLSNDAVPQAAPANLTWPADQYVRFHQTSGTQGKPLGVFDNDDDWRWWIECWQYVLDAAGVTTNDRAMLAFSFGPFIGFWSARDALAARGALIVPGGGMSSLARLDLLARTGATVLLCTPTYALHLAEVAEANSINLARLAVNKIIVAGEPAGSVPSVRQKIETAWSAKLTDHAGASEVGAWGYSSAEAGDSAGRGIHVLESEFIAEFHSLERDGLAEPGELAHLVLTALGRYGMPAIRYRTGDLVRPTWPETTSDSDLANRFVLLRGGVLGRADDMMVIRGVNIFPTSIEQILRSFPEVVEYRITVRKRGAMDELLIEVEDRLEDADRIAKELALRLGLKVDVRLATAMSLPRFEGKARRFVDERR